MPVTQEEFNVRGELPARKIRPDRKAFVVAHWYGPQSETVDLQTKELSAGKKRLRFEQSETGDWEEGMYRVEVWIRGYKLGERRFQITDECGPDTPTPSPPCHPDST